MWLTNFLSEIRNLINPRWWVEQLFLSVKRFPNSFLWRSGTLMIARFSANRECERNGWRLSGHYCIYKVRLTHRYKTPDMYGSEICFGYNRLIFQPRYILKIMFGPPYSLTSSVLTLFFNARNSNNEMLIKKKENLSQAVEWHCELIKRPFLAVFSLIPFVISSLGWKSQHNMSWLPPSVSDIYSGYFEHQL